MYHVDCLSSNYIQSLSPGSWTSYSDTNTELEHQAHLFGSEIMERDGLGFTWISVDLVKVYGAAKNQRGMSEAHFKFN